MPHPFQAVPVAWRPALLRTAIYLALAASVAMLWMGWPLHNAAAPFGIASLELAPDSATATSIIDAWRQQHAGIRMDDNIALQVQNVPRGLDERAATLTLLGYPYAVLYCLALSMICVWMGSPRAGAALGWLIWAGGLADALENTLVLRTLYGDSGGSLVRTTHWVAWCKFAIIALCLAYATWALWRRWRRPALR